ncbi:metallophosphoesterase [Anaeromyxobacter sp. Fw109-5]|uniref:metallophosphoesterase n=1 Tax=Anaeromyxobacter sp. (strain Fw109-5) TaxID=404589 RepID=UPI0000ED6CA6|nr:metallophosphoesterase [Anaeromyxobacter sp. Fw109-5]ABS28465.1 metallophosphoesterase [Anaeromyxobacter sp. Fw109-5]
MTIWIASDWHLSPESPAVHGRLARAFLARALEAGVQVILNGDVHDALFAGEARAEAAHPEVGEAMAALVRAGRLARTAGNHDPAAGPPQLVLTVPGAGRVLVTHGHLVDPIGRSPAGQLGDAISRRFGRLAAVRGAARAVEAAAWGLAGERMLAAFRRRCLALVAREGCDLGVFGHVHVAHLAAGDPYANAGGLSPAALSYLVLERGEARLATLRAEEGGDSHG